MPGDVVAAVERDLKRLPKDLAESALAASALALAEGLDAHSSLTSKSMAAKALAEVLRELRTLAPPERKTDGIDDLAARRAQRLADLGGAAAES